MLLLFGDDKMDDYGRKRFMNLADGIKKHPKFAWRD
jgi:hypothetical protein